MSIYFGKFVILYLIFLELVKLIGIMTVTEPFFKTLISELKNRV